MTEHKNTLDIFYNRFVYENFIITLTGIHKIESEIILKRTQTYHANHLDETDYFDIFREQYNELKDINHKKRFSKYYAKYLGSIRIKLRTNLKFTNLHWCKFENDIISELFENIENDEEEEEEDIKTDKYICICGGNNKRMDIHEQTKRHRNFINTGVEHKNKSQKQRSKETFEKNKLIIYTCECGDSVKKTAKHRHEHGTKHLYFIKYGHKKTKGNHMTQCIICDSSFLSYNKARHLRTKKHKDFLTVL
jgi:hypothetical protein